MDKEYVNKEKLVKFIEAVEAEVNDTVYGEAAMYAEGMCIVCEELRKFIDDENYEYPYVPGQDNKYTGEN